MFLKYINGGINFKCMPGVSIQEPFIIPVTAGIPLINTFMPRTIRTPSNKPLKPLFGLNLDTLWYHRGMITGDPSGLHLPPVQQVP